MVYNSEYRKKYYKENKERIQEYEKAYRRKKVQEDPDYWRKINKGREDQEGFRRTVQLNTRKIFCSKNGIEFDITKDDLDWPTHCPILGLELTRGDRGKSSPSVDRIDPSKGYIKGNVRVISDLANRMKQNATREELRLFSENILKYMDGEI